MNKKEIIYLSAGLVVGAGIGFFINRKSIELYYSKLASEEIESVRTKYRLLRKEGYESPKEAMSEYVEKIESEDYDVTEKTDENVQEILPDFPGTEEHNVFDKGDPSKPYQISEKEYMEGEDDYDKDTVTYFEADDTLADEKDTLIADKDKLGAELLELLTAENRVIYIRNETIQTDFEVIRHPGSYAVTVLGMDEQLLHLEEPRTKPLKMRDNDWMNRT